jgi:hypothetical protein
VLCDLEDWQLRDIGLTCEDVMRECNRPLLADDAPWLSGKHTLHGDVYLRGRPAHKIRPFYKVKRRLSAREPVVRNTGDKQWAEKPSQAMTRIDDAAI